MKRAALGEIVECLDRKRVPVKESERVPGEVPYYGANGQQGWIDRAIFDEPLVIVAEDGGHFDAPERGVAYRISGPSWVNNHGHVLRATDSVDHDYLFHSLRNYNFAPYISGSTRSKLTQKQLMQAEIPLPPLDAQRRIAAILDQADALRTKRRQVLARLDELEQSIFLSMFGHDRELRSVSELCELVVDCVNRTAPTVQEATPYKMLRTTNVRDGAIDTVGVKYVTAEVFKQWNRRATPRRGDVLLTREAPVGEAGVLLSDDHVFLGQRLMLYRVNTQLMTSDYLAACFRSPLLQAQFDRLGSGSTVKHLPLPACRSFEIPVAPIEDQCRFSARVAAINELRTATRSQATRDLHLIATLQSRAFRGEL